MAPYDLRLSEVEVELHQHAAAGQRLFRADSIEAAEVETHVPLTMLRRLLGSVVRVQSPAESLDIDKRLDFGAIDAVVMLAGARRYSLAGTSDAAGQRPGPQHPYRAGGGHGGQTLSPCPPPDRHALSRRMYVRRAAVARRAANRCIGGTCRGGARGRGLRCRRSGSSAAPAGDSGVRAAGSGGDPRGACAR
ncbi:MAG: hypothetical protein U5P41_02710 [Gammaproteobacteria bacterium]|nr:hypothetical protein [Gammaproteobacteria bacterium]